MQRAYHKGVDINQGISNDRNTLVLPMFYWSRDALSVGVA
jgi:hypothetical protein